MPNETLVSFPQQFLLWTGKLTGTALSYNTHGIILPYNGDKVCFIAVFIQF